MQVAELNWGEIHPAVLRQSNGFVRRVAVIRLPTGAMRYCCPTTSTFVLLTDDETLARCKPQFQVRCPNCAELHLLDEKIEAQPVPPAM